MPLTPELSYAFLLVLIRTSALLVSAPLLSQRGIPAWTKIGFAVFFSLVLVPANIDHLPGEPQTLAALVEGVLREALFGLALGLAMQLIFLGMQMGSYLIGVQLGFGLGQVIDPQSGAQFGVLDQFYAVLVALVFFTVNGHHVVIQALSETVVAVPPGTFDPLALTAGGVASLATGLMVTAVRVAMPVVVALFLTDVGMGFVARTAPQTNILISGAPVKIGVGLVVLGASLPATMALMRIVIEGPLAGSSQVLLGSR